MNTSPVLVVIGTRPEAIKLFPIIRELADREISTKVLATGQQEQLLSETMIDLRIIPDISLKLMTKAQTLTDFLSRAILEIGRQIAHLNPCFTIVQGDTSTALAGALSSYLRSVPIGHVEAGLRSHDLYAPWPEEGNRRLIDSISSELWIPTSSSPIQVERDQRATVVGNTVVDTLRLLLSQEQNSEKVAEEDRHILVTLHRRESFGDRLRDSLISIGKLSEELEERVIFIRHPNPNVTTAIAESNLESSRVQIIDPLPYTAFVRLLANSSLVITDSGGLQEEACTLGIPLLVMRDTTERPEAVSTKTARLIGFDPQQLLPVVNEMLMIGKSLSLGMMDANSPFGDGFASQRIVEQIVDWTSK